MRTLPIVATLAALAVATPVTAQDTPQPTTRTRCAQIVIVSPTATGWDWKVARPTPRAIVVQPIDMEPGWIVGKARTERRANRTANLVADVLGGCR
jgi:hypothetical protein